MPSRSPPKVRKNPPPADNVKRADDVLDRMFVNVKLPKPPEPPTSDVPERPPGDAEEPPA